MKAAIVLSMDSPSLEQQTGEINALLNRIGSRFTRLELWLFYTDIPPDLFPQITDPLSAVRRIAIKHSHLPESYLELLLQLTDRYPMNLMLFSSDGLGKELATRLAYRLKGSSCLQVQECCLSSGRIQVIKPVYGNNLQATFMLKHPPYCLSMAKRPCSPAKMIPLESPTTERLSLTQTQGDWVKKVLTIPDPSDTELINADMVLVVGQGAKNKDTVDILQRVADNIGAALGASRPVVMNAWTDMNRLIGSSGLILSPKICIAAGVSGTAVFTAGIQSSEFILAINTDKNAPIFQIAHVGVIGELLPVLLELERVVLAERAKDKLPKGHESTDPGSREKND